MTARTLVLRGFTPLVLVALMSSGAIAQAPAANSARPAASKAAPAAAPRQAAPAQKPQAAASPADNVIAHVGSRDVTAEQVRAFVATLDAGQQAAIIRDPALLTQVVRTMLANQLVLKEALEKKWEQ